MHFVLTGKTEAVMSANQTIIISLAPTVYDSQLDDVLIEWELKKLLPNTENPNTENNQKHIGPRCEGEGL